jgi:exosortase E/protease (VPEID-CTERM system)
MRASEKPFSMGLATRVVCLIGLFVLELVVISTWLDTGALSGRAGLAGAVADFGAHTLNSLVVFSTVLLAFGYSKAKHKLAPIADQLANAPPEWRFLAGHCAAMTAFAFLSSLLFSGKSFVGNALVLAWLAAGISGIVTGVFFFIPPKTFRELMGGAGSAWFYATAAALITPALVNASRRLWDPATALTFGLVKSILSLFVKQVITIPTTVTIGTPKFSVEILHGCSGLEGVGLMLIFSTLWLWFFRNDYRFPRALLIVPIGILAIFLLNAVRIASLILIGNAGAGAVALGGFHSQAGWIAFNGVALALASVTLRVPWLSSKRTFAVAEEGLAEPSPAAYLMPFLAILAAGMISRATSGSFEWMYPVRFAAAAGALIWFRRKYAGMNWRFGWTAPLIGGVVFVLWIGLDRMAGAHSASGVPAGLAALPVAARTVWLVFRTLAAVITVPISEELAFRGFLLRRLISADFESVSFQHWSFLAVAVSSLAFGLLHGDRWIAGIMAGVLYAVAQRWRGSIGDAVAAHAVTNALICIWVLWGGHWNLW